MAKPKYIYSNTQLAQQLIDQGKPPLRILKICHPIIEVPVDISIEENTPHYHIIEQFMDRLICGNSSEETGTIVISSKDELFSLLGIDRKAYDIADAFFQDLQNNGHFNLLPNGAIQPLSCAYKSVATLIDFTEDAASEHNKKTARKYISRTAYQKMLFDQFSLELLPGFFSNEAYLVRDAEDASAEYIKNDTSVWLNPNPSLLSELVDLDVSLQHTKYVNHNSIQRGLPQGYKFMQISEGASCTSLYCTYYLAIFQTDDGLCYEAYDFRKLTPIPWLTNMYQKDSYKSARERIDSVCLNRNNEFLLNPLFPQWFLSIPSHISYMNGVMRLKNGNYEWTLQNWQLDELLSNCHTSKNQASLLKLANNSCMILERRSPGKMIEFKITEAQQRKLLEAGKASLPSKSNNENLAIRKRYCDAMRNLAKYQADDRQKGLDELQALSKTYPPAAYTLGLLSLHPMDHNTQPDKETAYQLLKLAAEKEYLPAMVKLTQLQFGKDPRYKDPASALKALEKAAQKDFAPAHLLLAICYGKTRRKALDHYLRSVELGCMIALPGLIKCYDPKQDTDISPDRIKTYAQLLDRYEFPELLTARQEPCASEQVKGED